MDTLKDKSLIDSSKVYYRFKFILLGDVSVGKTCIATKFINNTFQENYVCTVGVEFKVKTLNLTANTIVDLQVWDTCGQEKYRTLTRQYYRDANGIMLIFDLTNPNSFNEVENWIGEIRNNFPTKGEISILLIGNKSDLISERKISNSDINKFAKRYDLEYIEVSAKEGTNIKNAFENLSWMVIHKEDENSKMNSTTPQVPIKQTQSIKYFISPKENTKKQDKGKCC